MSRRSALGANSCSSLTDVDARSASRTRSTSLGLGSLLGLLFVLLIGAVTWISRDGGTPIAGPGPGKLHEKRADWAQTAVDSESVTPTLQREAAPVEVTERAPDKSEPGEPEVETLEVALILADFWGQNWPEIEAEILQKIPRLLEVSGPPPEPWVVIEERLDVVVDEWASDPFWREQLVSWVTRTEAGQPWVVPLTAEHLHQRGDLDVDDPERLAEHTLRDIERARADLVESVRSACHRLIQTGRVTKHLYTNTEAADRVQGVDSRVDAWLFSIPHRGYFIHFRLPKSEVPEIEQNRRQLVRMTIECGRLIRAIVRRG